MAESQLTLDHLMRMKNAIEILWPKTEFDDGADMSQATFDQLSAMLKVKNTVLLKTSAKVLPDLIHHSLSGIDIHIIPEIPLGTVEPCRCKERQRHE